jgi:uncharacterized protein (DUF305 family)
VSQMARRIVAVGAVGATILAACATTPRQESVRGGDTMTSPAAQARADGGRPPYTAADVRFMQDMIAHHAQALWMARLAPTHGARRDVRILAERIDVAQRDEIELMQRWLRERGQPAPGAVPHHQAGGHATPMPARVGPNMPGMLTHEQMVALEAARGPEFDRLFLTFMIQHHEGALTMVRQLFSSPGAGQDVNIFRFASDVEADQTTEIDRMQSMLATSSEGRRP